ncbi:MAG: HEAT repeat domain-containing protein [Candidatus Methanoculleus thermohydrogenotrophicum]
MSGRVSRRSIRSSPALKEKSWNTQLGAATRLIMMGRPAVDGLIRALREEDPDIQAAAASILGEMRTTAVAPLIDALDDENRFVRLVAARNLGKIGNEQAIEALIESLHREPDSEVRATVAEALGYMGGRQVIEPLTLAMQDRDEEVKIAAARSLGYIGDRRAVESLIRGLSDVDDRVRHAALEALKDPGGHGAGITWPARSVQRMKSSGPGLPKRWKRQAGSRGPDEELALYLMALDRWAEVERVGEGALPALTGALSDPSIEVRANAVKIIARIGGEESRAPLVEAALRDDTPVVRLRAERALVDMGEAAIPALTGALSDPSIEVRADAVRIIARIGGEESRAPLVEAALRDDAPMVRQRAERALVDMGEAAIPALTGALSDPSIEVRADAVRIIARIGGEESRAPLVEAALRDDAPMVRQRAERALVDMREAAIPALTGALSDPSIEVRADAVRIIARIGGEESRAPLVEAALRDDAPMVRQRAERALVDMGEAAIPALTGALSDPSIEVRADAVRIIARIGGEESRAPLVEAALRDDAPMVRQRAERALVDMGEAAIPALTGAAAEALPETRERLQRIIDEIRQSTTSSRRGMMP